MIKYIILLFLAVFLTGCTTDNFGGGTIRSVSHTSATSTDESGNSISSAITLRNRDNLFIDGTVTTTKDLYIGGNATVTNTLSVSTLEVNDDFITDFTGTNLTVTIGVLNATGGGVGGENDWQVIGDYLTPTTSIGLLLTASTTITATTTISGNSDTATDLTGGSYDLLVEGKTAESALIKLNGNGLFGILAGNVGSIDFNGVGFHKMLITPDSESFFIWLDPDNEVRFALPEAGIDKGTYSPRSMIIAGPWTDDVNFIKCSYWGFWALACDTGSNGADLGVQNDLQVTGSSYFAELLTASSTKIGNIGTQFIHGADGNSTSTGWFNLGATNGITELLGAGDLFVGNNATVTNHFEADATLYVKDSKVGIGTDSPVRNCT